MGADLYIKNMDRESQYTGFEVSQKAVDVGYFRDCYNSWGLFALMSATLDKSVSWWQMADNKDWFRKDQEHGHIMTTEGVKQWRAYLQPLLKEFLASPKIYRNEYAGNNQYKKHLIKDKKDVQSIKDHAHLLERFIQLAIEKQSEIIWSV